VAPVTINQSIIITFVIQKEMNKLHMQNQLING